MKIYKWIVPLIFLALILLLFLVPIPGWKTGLGLTGCKKSAVYQITVYEEPNEEAPSVSGHYQASKIIEFSKTSVRFIDLSEQEMFKAGDKIEVQRINKP